MIANDHLKNQQRVLNSQQRLAQTTGQSALEAFAANTDGNPYANRMEPLVNGEMNWVLSDLNKLTDSGPETLRRAEAIKNRQSFILKELMKLLGRVADDTKEIKLPDVNVPTADEGLPIDRTGFCQRSEDRSR